MSISYTYDADKSHIITKVSGVVTTKETLEYMDRINADPRISKPFYEIVDFADTDNFDFGYFESNQLIEKLAKLREDKGYMGTILIADRDLIQGMSNMFQSIGECHNVPITVVHSFQEAEDMISNLLEAG